MKKTIYLSLYRLLGLGLLCLSFACVQEEGISPYADFEVDIPEKCILPCELTFKNLSTNADHYLWQFEDGTTSTELSPGKIYEEEGTFEVQLEVTNEFGSSKRKKTFVLEAYVDQTLTADFSIEKSEACTAPCSILFNNLSKNAVRYEWSFGDGNISSAIHPTHIYERAGSYTIILRAFHQNDEVAIAQQEIQINEPPVPLPIACFSIVNNGCTAACEINFINCSENVGSFEWDFGDGVGSSLYNPTHKFTQAGEYLVTLRVTNTAGQTDEITQTVTIKEPIYNYTKAYIKKVELLEMNVKGGLWDPFTAPDLFFMIDNDGTYTPPSTLYLDVSDLPVSWNYTLPSALPNDIDLSLHFYDEDHPDKDTYIGRSDFFNLGTLIEARNFADVLELSNQQDQIKVRIYLEWQ